MKLHQYKPKLAIITNLNGPPPKQRAVQREGGFDELGFGELDVGEALGAAVVLVAQYRHPVHRSRSVEVGFQLLGRRSVVNLFRGWFTIIIFKSLFKRILIYVCKSLTS